uniref:Concanavalin A-like lectin/glucanases superfamily protein n=1 Tax=Candidatus Kentrum sp. UNK TaxID=2126344 RepID=A0A451AMR2_9GAMM|nr:MAG: Concanavalin A-like lectin/glucanases superfamily protein [Candidatus Kentron sp. UNK]VFK72678.1 MAG: Concanavalin A-like lectin/glucanases superfamily protein [Candidatus Kentron sp. UNK]
MRKIIGFLIFLLYSLHASTEVLIDESVPGGSGRNIRNFQIVEYDPAIPQATIFYIDGYGDLKFLVAEFEGIDLADTRGLVAHYPFDGSTNDLSGNNNHGVVYGATLTEDRFGKPNSAYWFDGNDKIIVDALRNFEWGNKFSVSVWFKRTGQWGNYQGIVNNGYYTNGSWEIRMSRENSGTMLGGGVITPTNNAAWDHANIHASGNQWHHVVMTYDGNTLSFYLDGELKGMNTRDVGILIAKNTPLTIGQAGTGKSNEYFYGVIDDIKIYKKAISIAGVRTLYDYQE